MLDGMPSTSGTETRPAPAWRRWGRRFAALLLGLLLALASAEGFVRAAGLHVAHRGGKTTPLLERVPDPLIGFRLVPGNPRQRYVNADGTETQVAYTINAEGWRGRPVREQKPPGTLRIAVLGDSFVFGTGVPDEGTLPRTLERDFEEQPLPGLRVQVLNFGVPGYGIEQLLPRLERDAARYDPDVVLVCLYINDAVATEPNEKGDRRIPVEPNLATPQMEWIDRLGLTSNLAEPMELTPPAQRRMFAIRKVSRLADLIADRLFLELFSEHTLRVYEHRWRADGPGWKRVVEVLAELKHRSEQSGFQLQLAFYPLLDGLDHYPYREIHGRVGATCAELGVPFHDLLEPLGDLEPSSLWAHVHDHHPNAYCNHVAGRWLAARMRALLVDAGASAGSGSAASAD